MKRHLRSRKSGQSTTRTARKNATPSYELVVELSEKQVEADVAAYFGHVSALAGEYGRFRLLDVNEQLTGADKKFEWDATTYFLQFKKPQALIPMSAPEAVKALRANADTKQIIRKFRYDNSLESDPYALCFKLRVKASTAHDFQHNILLSFEAAPSSRAMYVCPLEISSARYVDLLRQGDWPDFPFFFRPFQWILEGRHAAFVARTIPFLRGHMAIVPHKRVDSSSHYYSFSSTATDLAFHSPELLAKGPIRLADFVADEWLRIYREQSPMENVLETIARLRRNIPVWDLDGTVNSLDSDLPPLEWLQWHGRRLLDKTGIRQFVLLRKTSADPA